MRKLIGLSAAVVALGTAAVTGTSIASASDSTGPATPQHFTVIEHALTDTVADTGPKGDSLGDVLAFANPLFDGKNAKKVGSDNGSCIRTAVGAAWECSWTNTLAGGSLVVQGPFYDAADSTLAVTGGTGVYRDVTGQMRLHARNAQGTAYDFVFSLSHH